MLVGFNNETLLNVPWENTVAWLSEGSHYVHIELLRMSDDRSSGGVRVTEVYNHHTWIYGVFWLFLGVLITVIMHIPIYTYLGKERHAPLLPKSSATCPPKYENDEHVIEVVHNQSYEPLISEAKEENDKLEKPTNP